ncbi:MAG: zinc-ribbon and DUF3426 domain-containing protein [Gallionella sp.]|jgi:predicted Zn finger-like uncharacterized protein|nr:zinc-ribbon and DUF3426 domain-containing protein [Gallionella sp.]MCK9354069.1 zinc-ribbon and DUF3426 domain-containing protein [Gallionella sp.]
MNGTTLCPHCNTRFRIAGEQLDAHQGMVRCGHCMQAFDARPGFIPDQPDPQLELPIVEQRATQSEAMQPEPAEQPTAEPVAVAEAQAESPEVSSEPVYDISLDFAANDPQSDEMPAKPLVIQPAPLAGGEAPEEEEIPPAPRKRRWLWITASSLLALLLLLQTMYFFRVELAARLPGLKPVLIGYCMALDCTVPLPQNPDLMSIESSELEADPEHENQIVLVALLRNRATHVQAFPVLELSLNDTQDKVVARRLFKPADYLPATESEAAGLRPNRELNIRLRLDTTDLRPTGYRLALFYPQ